MAFPYNTNLDAVMNTLKGYNTTTAAVDLSNNLNVRVDSDNIFAVDPELTPPRADRMPCLYVTIDSKNESYEGIGATGVGGTKKQASVFYNIFAVVGKYGGWESQSVSTSDIYYLAENIEGIFQEEYDLSNTALWCNANTTEFFPPKSIGDQFAKVCLVRLEARYLFR